VRELAKMAHIALSDAEVADFEPKIGGIVDWCECVCGGRGGCCLLFGGCVALAFTLMHSPCTLLCLMCECSSP
jgi:hypothetical protein